MCHRESVASERSLLQNYLNRGYSVLVCGTSDTALRLHLDALRNVANAKQVQSQESEAGNVPTKQREWTHTFPSSSPRNNLHNNNNNNNGSNEPCVHVIAVYRPIAQQIQPIVQACACCQERIRASEGKTKAAGVAAACVDVPAEQKTQQQRRQQCCQWAVFVNRDYMDDATCALIASDIGQHLVDPPLLKRVTLRAVYHECRVINDIFSAFASGNLEQFQGASQRLRAGQSRALLGEMQPVELFPQQELAQEYSARMHRELLVKATQDNEPVGVFESQVAVTAFVGVPWSDTFVIEHVRVPLYEGLTRNDSTWNTLRAMHASAMTDLSECLQKSEILYVVFPWHERDVSNTRLRAGLRFSCEAMKAAQAIQRVSETLAELRKREWILVAQFPTREEDPLPPPPPFQAPMALAAGAAVRVIAGHGEGRSQSGIVESVLLRASPCDASSCSTQEEGDACPRNYETTNWKSLASLPSNYAPLLSLSLKLRVGGSVVVSPKLQVIPSLHAMHLTATVLPLTLNYAISPTNFTFWNPLSDAETVRINPQHLLSTPDFLRRSLSIVRSFTQLRFTAPLRWSHLYHGSRSPSREASMHPSLTQLESANPSSPITHCAAAHTPVTLVNLPQQQQNQRTK